MIVIGYPRNILSGAANDRQPAAFIYEIHNCTKLHGKPAPTIRFPSYFSSRLLDDCAKPVTQSTSPPHPPIVRKNFPSVQHIHTYMRGLFSPMQKVASISDGTPTIAPERHLHTTCNIERPLITHDHKRRLFISPAAPDCPP